MSRTSNKIHIPATSNELAKETTAAQVARLKAQGMSTSDIAQQLQIDPATVRNMVKETLEKVRAEREEYGALLLDLELERLDMMQNAIWPAALAGKLTAQDRVMNIMDKRAKYLGMYAPTETKITGDGGPVNVTVVYVDEPIERDSSGDSPSALTPGADGGSQE